MLTEKDLAAIGQVIDEKLNVRFDEYDKKLDQKLDQKFKKELKPIKSSIAKINKTLKPIRTDIKLIKKDMNSLIEYYDKQLIDMEKRFNEQPSFT